MCADVAKWCRHVSADQKERRMVGLESSRKKKKKSAEGSYSAGIPSILLLSYSTDLKEGEQLLACSVVRTC